MPSGLTQISVTGWLAEPPPSRAPRTVLRLDSGSGATATPAAWSASATFRAAWPTPRVASRYPATLTPSGSAAACRGSAICAEATLPPVSGVPAYDVAVKAAGVTKTFRIPQEQVSTLKERVLHPGKRQRFDVLRA